jgi:acyl carrier protein
MQGLMHERVRDVIADVLRVAPTRITYQSDLSQDLRADSLDLIELSMQLEEAFGIEIHTEDMQYFSTVRQIIDYLGWKVNEETN